MAERLRTPNWVIDLITALWVQAAHRRMASGSLVDQPAAPISEELEEKWQQLLGSEMPRIRKVQEVIAETKQRFNLFLHRDTVEPLGTGWPRSPHDVFYLMKLDKLAINEGIDPSAVDWTNDEIDVALELREILEPHFQVDKTTSTTGLLQHPYLGVDIPAELAIIKELAIRRRLEQEEALPGGQVYYRDLYLLLLERGTNESFEKDKGIRFSRKKWSPILHEASGRRAVDAVTSALESLHRSAEAYRITANLEDQKWGLPDYPGQPWGEWLERHDDYDYPDLGFQGVQDDYVEKLVEDLQEFVGEYHHTLEILEKFAPVSRIETSHLKCGVMSSIGTSLPEYQKHSFIRDSPLSSTWNMCLSAKVLADSIMSHYLDLEETEMIHLVDNRRFGEPFDDVSNNFELCLLNLPEEDMMEAIFEMEREGFLNLGLHPLRSGHVESSTNGANPEQIQDYFEVWCPACNRWLSDTYQ